jgi:hypothetical protein
MLWSNMSNNEDNAGTYTKTNIDIKSDLLFYYAVFPFLSRIVVFVIRFVNHHNALMFSN